MGFFHKLSKRQKRLCAAVIACLLIVCLLIELIGRIPGIPFNGWSDIFSALGMSQNTVVPEGELQVHFINVGNADCILVRQEEHNMLIDAGETGDYATIADYLNRQGVEKLDLVIATHPHADHIGSMADVIENFPIDRFIMSFMPEGKEPTTITYLSMLEALDKRDVKVDEAVPGETYTLGTAQLQILAPLEEDEDANAISVVTRLTFGKRAFLFTGDAESPVEGQMIAQGYNLKADVLKVGHHGSRTSSSAAFLRAVAPQYAVVTCGEDNRYNHPHDEAMKRLTAADVEYYRADLYGDIVFTTDGTSLTLKTQKGD